MNDVKINPISDEALNTNPASFLNDAKTVLNSKYDLCKYSSGMQRAANNRKPKPTYFFNRFITIENAINVKHRNIRLQAKDTGAPMTSPVEITKLMLNAKNSPQAIDPLKSVFMILYKNGNKAKI